MNNTVSSNLNISEEEGVDIKKYIFLVLTRWWWFVIIISVCITTVYMVNRYSQEVYSATCTVIIGEEESAAGSIESILSELSRARNRRRKAVVENEITILKSYNMARLALEELDFDVSYTAIGRRNIAENRLYISCPFIVEVDSANRYKLTGKYFLTLLSDEKFSLGNDAENQKEYYYGEEIENGDFSFRIVLREKNSFIYDPQKSNKYYFIFNDLNSLAKAYSNALSVEVNSEKGSILSLRVSGFVPRKITNYLNILAEVYVRTNLEEKNRASENTIVFIDEQLRGVVDSLEITGLRLQQFRSANKLINLSEEGRFLFEQMRSLQNEKASAEIKRRYYNYLLEYIKNRYDFRDIVAPSVIGIDDNLLNTLVAKLNKLNLELQNLKLSVKESSPQVRILENQVANTRESLRENLESLVEGSSISMDEILTRIGKVEKEVQKLPGTERQLINIEREFSINDQIYTFLLEKRAEAGITRASNTSDHKILDIARPENVIKIKPKESTNYIMALVVGSLLLFILLIIMDFFNTKITDRKYLEFNLKPSIIGNIGHNGENSELPVNENPRSSIAESFRALRTNLQYILKVSDAKTIAISSAVSGEGKTFTSINLASIIALSGKKTLIISLDLRKPKVHKVFNLRNEKGMSTYLININTFEEIISETNIINLDVVTSGPVPPNPAELLSSDRLRQFINRARNEYDFIILDTPPIAIVTDTLILKDLLDAFIFVIRHNFSDKQVVGLVNSIYDKHLIKNTGVVVNDIQVRGYSGYSYRYGYGYGYGYSYSYRTEYYDDKKNVTTFRAFYNKIFRNKA